MIAIAFRPIAQGTRTGSLTIANSAVAPYNSLSTSLTGTGTATLSSIAVTPINPTVGQGGTQPFTATGSYSDGTTKDITSTVTWSSLRTTVATIASGGLATALAQGSTTIRAATGRISGTSTLTVAARTLVSLAVSPNNPAIPLGTTQQFTATGTYSDGSTQNLTSTAIWSSSATGVATISATGLANSHTVGSATIKAASGAVSGQTTLNVSTAALVSISVTPTSASIPLGTTQQFAATGTFTDGSTQSVSSLVTWTSSAPSFAAVDATGLAAGKGTGAANIGFTRLVLFSAYV